MTKKILSCVCFVLRYTLMFFFFAYIHLISFSSSSVTPAMLMELEYSLPIILTLMKIGTFMFVFPAYFSVARTFSITEPKFNKAVSENKENLQNFTDKASFVISTPYIYLELLIVSFFVISTSYASIFIKMHSVIPATTPKNLLTLILIAASFLISLLARISAIKELCYKATFEEIKFGRADRKFGIWYLVRNCLLLSFIYPIAVIMIPYILSICAIPFLFEAKDTLTIISIIIFVVAVLLTMKYWRLLYKRRKFLRKLKKYCKKNKYRLENETKMLSSALKEHDGANFVINANGKRYACKLLASKNKGDPMYFTENGELYVVKSKSFTFLGGVRGMGGAGATINSLNFSNKAILSSFAFESEYTKVVIVNPISAKIFVGHPEHSMAIDVGSTVGDYHIYNASGFMNAVERDCVDAKKRY